MTAWFSVSNSHTENTSPAKYVELSFNTFHHGLLCNTVLLSSQNKLNNYHPETTSLYTVHDI